MQEIVTAEEMYQKDQYTITHLGISEQALIECVAQRTVDHLINICQKDQRLSHSLIDNCILVACGMGNNGGDGYATARRLKLLGCRVACCEVGCLDRISDGCKQARESFLRLDGVILSSESCEMTQYDIIIDAMLGIGVKGGIREPYLSLAKQMALSGAVIVSIDVPSGISGDHAQAAHSVQAHYTLTVQNYKRSAFLFPAREHYGEIMVLDVGIHSPNSSNTYLLDKKFWKTTTPDTIQNSHKGTYGRGVIIGGSKGYYGSVVLSTVAAEHNGVGLLSVAAPPESAQALLTLAPEAMQLHTTVAEGFLAEVSLPERIDALAFGMGIGISGYGRKLLRQVLSSDTALLLDADGLTLLAEEKDLLKQRKNMTILTPHSGELARLTGYTIAEIEGNRFDIARSFAMEYRCYLVLKGPYTIVTTPKGVQYVNTTGNAGLAKGGSGDVLSGMLLGELCRERSEMAICRGVYRHGLQADALLRAGKTREEITPLQIARCQTELF